MRMHFQTPVRQEKRVSIRFWEEPCECQREETPTLGCPPASTVCLAFHDPLLRYHGVASSSEIQVPALWSRVFCFRKHFASVSCQEFLPLMALLLGFSTK